MGIVASLGVTTVCYSQSQYAALTETSSGAASDAVNDVVHDSSGNIYSTGYFTTGTGTSSFATMGYTSNGNDLWSAPVTYTGTGTGLHVAVACVLDETNGVLYVTGYSVGSSTNYDIVVLKYDASDGSLHSSWASTGEGVGIRRWNRSGVNGADIPVAILVDTATENVYVFGTSYGGSTPKNDYALLKFESDGDMDTDFPVFYDAGNSGDDVAADMSFSGKACASEDTAGLGAASVFVTGTSYGGSGNGDDYLTIRYDTDDGSVISGWPKRYNGVASGDDVAVALAVSCGGDVYVTGYVPEASVFDTPTGVNYLTIAYQADGTNKWSGPAEYDGPPATDSDIPVDIVANDSYVRVTGYSSGSTTGLDILTVKYNNGDGSTATGWSGGLRWDSGSSLEDRPVEMALESTTSSNIYIAGFRTVSGPDIDWVTLKYDGGSSPSLTWSILYPTGGGGGNDRPNALTVDAISGSNPNGNPKAIVGGFAYTNSTTGFDFKTVKYSQ
ncbi:MAG: hypothetical protein AB7G11_08510 [Phycisphaerales bacterium]